MPKLAIPALGSGFRSSNRLNDNFDTIADAFDKALFRDGTGPNGMEAELDMGLNKITNVADPDDVTDAVNKGTMEAFLLDGANTLTDLADLTLAARDDAVDAKDASQGLYDSIAPAVSGALTTITGTAVSAQNTLNTTKDNAVSTIASAQSSATTAVATQQGNSVAAVVGAQATALTTISSVVADVNTLSTDIHTFVETSVYPLPDRVSALESPFTVALAASTTQSEVGTSVTVTLTATYNQALASASIDQSVGAVATTSGAHSGISTGGAVTTNKTWTLTGSNGYTSKTATASITFLNRMMWGTYATNDLATKTAAQIRTALVGTSALASDITRTFSVDAGTGTAQYVYFAAPATFVLSTFTAFGFDELSNLTTTTVNINDAAGTPVAYKLYRLPNALNGVIPMVTHA
jgi:hypothetical protein